MPVRKHRNIQPVAHTSPEVCIENVTAIRELFPECVADGKIDFDRLRQSLGDEVDGQLERYAFTWPGKRDAIRLLQIPSRSTLIPREKQSVRFDSTKQVFIEGDNLEVLKLLYKSYFAGIGTIYIDPPYNTGNDFIYSDDFSDPLHAYLEMTRQKDEHGNLLTSNPETSGRFHSSWLSMMYPRLFLGRQLLREDGAIWISIDDTEMPGLRQICNEIFGEENFVATFIWEKRTTRENRRVFSFNHDYIVCYAKNKPVFQGRRNLLPLSERALARYSNPDNDPRGEWQSVSLNAQAGHATPAQFYKIRTPGGRTLGPPPGRCWSVTKERMQELIADNRVWFGMHGKNVPREKIFISEAKQGLTPHTLWTASEVGTNDSAKKALIELFSGKAVYETPKPVELLKRILTISSSKDDLILDFFAGSATTAHAVFELNRQDGGTRRCISVQLPEPTPPDSAARKAGHKTVSDVGEERLRRVIAGMTRTHQGKLKLKAAHPEDLGFRVFRLAESNYKLWTGVEEKDPEAYAKTMELFVDPLVVGWTGENVTWEVAIKEGFGLNAAITKLNVKSNDIFQVTDPDKAQRFCLCLDPSIQDSTISSLDLKQDDLFVCLDSALDDAAAANLALQCRLKTI